MTEKSEYKMWLGGDHIDTDQNKINKNRSQGKKLKKMKIGQKWKKEETVYQCRKNQESEECEMEKLGRMEDQKYKKNAEMKTNKNCKVVSNKPQILQIINATVSTNILNTHMYSVVECSR